MLRFAPRWNDLRDTLERAERWLLPGACLLCGELTGGRDDPLICEVCLNRFASLPEPQCQRCGQPLTPGIACRLCEAWPAGLSGVRSAVWLEEGARRTVHLFKYEGWWRLAEPLADTIAKRVGLGPERPATTNHPPPTILVPIPLSPARLRKRGYNQSAMLAAALARRSRWAVADVLRRGRDTGTQTALTPEERRANLAGAFVVQEPPPPHPVLVDDVFTTGATLAEAAQVLLQAGAETVQGVTFARALRPLARTMATLASR